MTGSAGFIGFHLCRLLLDEGFVVHGYDGMTDYYDVELKKSRHAMLRQSNRFACTEAMLEDYPALSDAMGEFLPNVVIHLAAQAGVRYSLENPRAYIESNVVGTFNVIEQARELAVDHLLFASTSSVYGANEEAILDISRKMDDCIAEGIEKADIFVITLGLAETWRNIENGLHICLPPYDDARGGLDRFPHLEFYFSNYQDNYDNLKRVCTLINDNLPGRNIVLTVSPVGLGRTYPERDVVVATIEAKSILRAVAGQLSREFDNVHYWPSYDLCVKDDIYREDGRHVRPDAVAMIVDTFIEAYTAPALAVAV